MINNNKKTILLVDDEPVNLQVLKHTLEDQYRLLFATNGAKAIELANAQMPDLILLDIMMPKISGYDVCKTLQSQSATSSIPIIFITALSDESNEQLGFDMGAVDYITKPFSPAIVRARVKSHLSLVQMNILKQTRLQIIQCLGTAAEYKDNETSKHIIRMSHYSHLMAEAAGYNTDAAEELYQAAPMHDIGKIGIPDSILKKPGKLDPHEWEIMQQHTTIGAQIIGKHESSLLQLSSVIALNHHEKWDGSGYPQKIKGEDIPHEARIITIADVFDALTSVRPYKKAWSVEEAVSYIKDKAGSQFDPNLVPIFLTCLPQILEVKEKWEDTIEDHIDVNEEVTA